MPSRDQKREGRVTIIKAREIIKDAGKDLTDEQVQDLIDSFNLIIDVGLEQFEKTYNTGTKEVPINQNL